MSRFTHEQRDAARRAAVILVEAGWTQGDAAAVVGYARSSAPSLFGSPGKRGKRPAPNIKRNARMAEMYREGQTLEEIGLSFGITRERVRQILSKSGLSRQNGGAFYRKGERDKYRVEQRRAARDAHVMLLFGVGWDAAVALNGDSAGFRRNGSPACAYLNQKRNAETRNIPWSMTFAQWMDVWRESGHWPQRGRGKGKYCMARKGDAGDYAVGNVQIITTEENIAEGYRVNPASRRFGVPMAQKRARQHKALELRREGKSHREIAALLGISASTSLQYCVNAKRLAA